MSDLDRSHLPIRRPPFQGVVKRTLEGSQPDWDQIGHAAALLELGDTGEASVLLHWATAGDAPQQKAASLALYRGVAPLLETIGRWPLDATVHEGELWPADLVADVRQRCRGLNLQAIADDTRIHLAYESRLRRDVARLTSLRNRLTRYLWAP